MAEIAVFYLSRWGAPAALSEGFFASLRAHPAGADHELVVMLKGFPDDVSDPALERHQRLAPTPVRVLRMRDEGKWGFNAFVDGAAQLTCARIVFFTSQSRIMAHDWLAVISRGFDAEPRCGMLGATASWEGVPSAPFPNPNVRANAFAIDRRLFLSLDRGGLGTLAHSLLFEAGPNGMTRQIERMGLEALVVDRQGARWRAAAWPASRTFRSGAQENLLVADNRTHHYDVASPSKRRRLAALAFGDRAMVTPASPLARWRAYRAWRAHAGYSASRESDST